MPALMQVILVKHIPYRTTAEEALRQNEGHSANIQF